MWPFFRNRIDSMSKCIIWIVFKGHTLKGIKSRFINSEEWNLTQVGIHFACSLPKPFRAWAFKRSSWFCRSLTIRISITWKIIFSPSEKLIFLSIDWFNSLWRHRYLIIISHLRSIKWSCPSSSIFALEGTGTICGLLEMRSADVTWK
jgi:hypothetical protein